MEGAWRPFTMLLYAILALVASSISVLAKLEDHQQANVSVRLWLDSAFFSSGEVQIFKDIVANSSGRMVVSGETQASFMSTKGAYVPQSWDLYWTVRRACHSVLGAIAPPKRVNCVPGIEAVAYKQPLVRTMQEAYGEAAFDFIPRSYMLPSQYWVWRAWTQRTGSPPDLPWVLKANDHRGRGVRVMRQQQAQRQALRGSGAQAQGDTATQKGFVLVQSYVRQQFLYDNRPSYLRLWVVVTSVRPLRAYFFRGGVLVFGDRLDAGGGAVAGGGSGARRRRGGSGDNRRRRELRQQQQAASGSSGPRTQQAQQQPGYEMHAVNYWTIAGEKMKPWTVAQLRRHAEAAVPTDPRVFEKAWAHARDSVGKVLAAAARRMRAASRGLAALEGCGFEVLGVDFLLNSTFHPTLVELNALPSLARLRTAPGDPAHGAATGADGAVAATAAAAAAVPFEFDLEKERFLHHAIRLIGMPIGPPPFRGGGVGGSSAAGADAAATSPPPPSVGGVLRAMVALLRPPNNETAELQSFLRLHLPNDVAAAEAALPSLKPLLCPVSAAWGPAPGWPVLEATTTATGAGRRLAAAVAATAAEDERDAEPDARGKGSGGGGRHGVKMAAATRPAQPMGRLDLSRHVALGRAPQRGGGRRRPGARGPKRVGGVAASAGAASGAAAAMAAARGDAADELRNAAGKHDPAVEVVGRGRQLRELVDAAQGTTAAGGATATVAAATAAAATAAAATAAAATAAAATVAAGTAAAATVTVMAAAAPPPCRQRCYDWDVLSALADTEYELQQDLDFDPIFPMAAAHDLNGAALEAARKAAAAAVHRSRTGGAEGSESGIGSALLESDPQTGFQRLSTGLGFVRESITSVNMDLVRSMQYMTTTPYILASTKLPYNRIDAALVAFEAVRRRPGGCASRLVATAGGGGGGADDVGACAVRVLQDTLDELCSGRVKLEQE